MKVRLFTSILRPTAAVAALAMAGIMMPAHATNLVLNGGFETSDNGAGQIGYNTTVANWSVPAPNGSYAFLFTSGSGDTTGANGEYGNVSLWGPNNGPANGLPATSPDGGNYIGMDADFQQGAISQTINGLIAGEQYTLSFFWAGAQQSGFDGPTVEQWNVSLGSETQSTSEWDNPSHGFSGWQADTMTFTADTTGSEVLSFFATGLPAGPPPFALLDGVTLNATSPVPEPSSVALLLTGFAGVGGMIRARFKKVAI